MVMKCFGGVGHCQRTKLFRFW